MNELWKAVFFYDEMLADNQRFESENAALIVENSRLKIHEEENRILKKYVHFSEANGFSDSSLMASVIGMGETDDSVYYINRGSSDGIRNGLPVLTSEGVLMGKIVETFEEFSAVMSVVARQSKVHAVVLHYDTTAQVVSGEHGLGMKMEYIPQDSRLQKGDIVITSGFESHIPKGIVIGKISEIFSSPNDPFQSAFVKPVVNYSRLSTVMVLLPKI